METSFQPYEGTEPYIFISYARKDREQVLPLLEALNLTGYRLWYDNGIQAGERWRDSLAEHIIGCAVFMPFISPAFTDSVNCYDEAAYARTKNREILPVYLQKRVELPPGLDMALHPIQWRKLSDYSGNATRFICSLENEDILKPCHRTNDTEKTSAFIQESPSKKPLSADVEAWHPEERYEGEKEKPSDNSHLTAKIILIILILVMITVALGQITPLFAWLFLFTVAWFIIKVFFSVFF